MAALVVFVVVVAGLPTEPLPPTAGLTSSGVQRDAVRLSAKHSAGAGDRAQRAVDIMMRMLQKQRFLTPFHVPFHVQRRAAERADDFRTTCRMRGGIEATNSMLKRVTGLDRLRMRGRPAVFSSILLKVAGWNLLRAASVRSLINKLTKGGVPGQSALAFVTPYRRHAAFSSPLTA